MKEQEAVMANQDPAQGIGKHTFRQNPAKQRSFCSDCKQPKDFIGHPGGTEPYKSPVAGTLEVITPAKEAAKRAAPKKKRA